jgi:tetratricopeptide (TPR) repeat protein
MRAGLPLWVSACILSACASAQQPPELPRIDTANFLPAIQAQVNRAEEEARARPQDAKAAGAFAMTLHAYEKYDAAARVYEYAHWLDPQNFDWLYLLGAVQVQRGEFDAAVGCFQSAVQLHPDDLAAQLRLAEGLTALSRWDEAGKVYRQVLVHHPDSPQAWYGLGRVNAANGDQAGAAQCYTKACDLFPAYGAAQFALAAELRRLGKDAEAEAHLAVYSKHMTDEPPLDDPLFKRIHELNQSVTVHIQRATELEKAGRLDEAIREHEAALAIDPNDVQVHVNLLSLYGRVGDASKAKQHFDAAIKLNPGHSDAWYDYGVLLFHEKQYADAEQAFRHALAINPYYAEAHNNLGAMYEQQGRIEDAAKEFREAIADRPDYSLARFHLGRILVNEEKYGEAIQQFLKTLTPEDENTTVYLYALAATYARSGDRGHALQYFQKARDSAMSHDQKQLLGNIERDLKTLDPESGPDKIPH